jgi:hypothetical protein
MSKINLDELQEMLNAGRKQSECAKHFNVSEAAICKAVKRLKAAVLPASMEKLTDKERVFVLNLTEGKSKTDAAYAAYDCVSRDVAKTLGCRLAKDPDVETALTDLMAQEGISKRQRIRRLKDLISSSDLSAVSKGLDMSWKLDGSYAPEKVDVLGQIASVFADVAAIRALEDKQKLTDPEDSDI